MNWMRGIGAAVLAAAASAAWAEVKLAPLFQDHMVLQREREVPVWGTADPGEEVTVIVAEQGKRAVADEKGKWQVRLDPLRAGGPWGVEVKGKASAVKLQDVLVGDVWVCSGQSNMDMRVVDCRDGAGEASRAHYPQIRLLKVPIRPAAEEQSETAGQWAVCSPTTVGDFSGAAYFFGREIHQKLNVPIGLIQSAVGGTPAESWTPVEELAKHPETKPILEQWQKELAVYPQAKAAYDKQLAEWTEKYQKEPENAAETKGWAKPEFAASDWPTMKVPQHWQRVGLKHNGTVWFRKEVDVPAEWAGHDLVVELGRIDDCDQTYFNGQRIGQTWRDNPWAVFVHRKYTVPGKLVKAGRNVVAVRVFDTGGDGGFAAEAGQMKVSSATEPGEPIPLEGEWRYQVEQAMRIPPMPAEPRGPANAWTPGTLWNGMVRPLVPYAIRGAIWYQGESNAGKAEQYQTLFPAMIAAWRERWGQGDFPFYFVQLANFGIWKADPAEPADSVWAELREAQSRTWERVPNTGMAVAIDIGDAVDIHPKNKQDVGRRLALAALANTYGRQELAFTGPILQRVDTEGRKVRLRFRPGAERLDLKGGSDVKGFAVAGEDKVFHRAEAYVEGHDTVVVYSDKVERPVAVRYGWADNPTVNLYNSAGLPASPFRTDSWPGVTTGKR